MDKLTGRPKNSLCVCVKFFAAFLIDNFSANACIIFLNCIFNEQFFALWTCIIYVLRHKLWRILTKSPPPPISRNLLSSLHQGVSSNYAEFELEQTQFMWNSGVKIEKKIIHLIVTALKRTCTRPTARRWEHRADFIGTIAISAHQQKFMLVVCFLADTDSSESNRFRHHCCWRWFWQSILKLCIGEHRNFMLYELILFAFFNCDFYKWWLNRLAAFSRR